MNRLHIFTVSAAVAGAGALAAMALSFSFLTVFVCMCVATLMAFAAVASEYALRRQLELVNGALGQFMRGQWQARTQPGAGDDEICRMQHRINNLLDTIDLHVRAEEAAIDHVVHTEYVEKLKTTPLALALADECPPEEAAPAGSVGALLQQLGHDVAGLFTSDGEPKTEAAPPVTAAELAIEAEAIEALAQRLRDGALRLQEACSVLSQRALPAGFTGPGPSPATLETSLARLAEQTTVISLNVAIEAARAHADSSLHGMAEELHDMAALLQKARGEVQAALGPHHRQPGPVSVPLAAAMEQLALAEQTLRHEASAVDALLAPAMEEALLEEAA